MTDDFVYYLGLALLALFAIWLLFFPLVLYRLCAVIRDKRPDEWVAHTSRKAGIVSTCAWIASVIFGHVKLDIADDDYRRKLRRCRLWLGRCLLYLLVSLGMIAWAKT